MMIDQYDNNIINTTLHCKNTNSPGKCVHISQHKTNYQHKNNNFENFVQCKSFKSYDVTDSDRSFGCYTIENNRRRKSETERRGAGTSSSLNSAPITRSHRQSINSHCNDWLKQPLDVARQHAATERLTKLKYELEKKSIKIRNLKCILDQLHITDNIDLRIRQAELEYAISREELQLMSLAEEMRLLKASLEKCRNKNPNIYDNIRSGVNLTLHAIEVKMGLWSLQEIPAASGIYLIEWCLENDCNGLHKGDRLLELNGQLINCFSKVELRQIMSHKTGTCQMVVIREQQSQQLHQKNQQYFECRNQKDKDKEKRNITLLQNRIAYLEEQVKELQTYKIEQNLKHDLEHKDENKQFGHVTSISISSSPKSATPPISTSMLTSTSASISTSTSASTSTSMTMTMTTTTTTSLSTSSSSFRPLESVHSYKGNCITTLVGGRPIKLWGDDDNNDVKSSIDPTERTLSKGSYPLLGKSKSTSNITKTLLQGYYNSCNNTIRNSNSDTTTRTNSMNSMQLFSNNNFNINSKCTEKNSRILYENSEHSDLEHRNRMIKKMDEKNRCELYSFEDHQDMIIQNEKIVNELNVKPKSQNAITIDNESRNKPANTFSQCYMNKVKKYLSPDRDNGMDNNMLNSMRPKPPKKPLRLSLSLQRTQNQSNNNSEHSINTANIETECKRALKRTHLTEKIPQIQL